MNQRIFEALVHNVHERFLLRDGAVHLGAYDDGVRRDDEGVLSDSVADVAQGYTPSKRLAVVYDWLGLPIVDIHCSEGYQQCEHLDNQTNRRTFHAPAAMQ